MNEENRQLIEDVKFILNSGDTEIINTLKATIPAYLQCIAVKRQRAAPDKPEVELTLIKGKKIQPDNRDKPLNF